MGLNQPIMKPTRSTLIPKAKLIKMTKLVKNNVMYVFRKTQERKVIQCHDLQLTCLECMRTVTWAYRLPLLTISGHLACTTLGGSMDSMKRHRKVLKRLPLTISWGAPKEVTMGHDTAATSH